MGGRQRQQHRQQAPALPAAVGALCRALPPRARPAPDTLRRARFDRPQASLDFWRLLYVLLKQIHGGGWTESDAIGAQVRFVKSALWFHGYGRPQLQRLPADGSAGSRELLLAFSWLLHRLGLLEQLLARNRLQTGDEASVCTCEDELPSIQEDTAEAGPEDRVDVRYLQWLNGRLRLQWCSLHAQHQEQCKLLHKIHLFTSGSHMDQNLGHFSVTETDLIRQPENYKQLLQLLESETMQLEAFLEWKQLEPIYWQWMETVLDNMAEEGNMCESQGAHVEKKRLPEVNSCCPWADKLTGQMDRLSRDLMALQEQLHQLVAQRKALWWEKVAAREELQKERFSATARKIQESVELKLRSLTSLCAPKKNETHGLCRLVLRNKHPASKMGLGGCVSKEAVSAVSAAEVIRELQVREASLQRELEQLRQECRHRLDEIAGGLEGVICISH
ncbi:tubulin epsilon and delta complex protein 1 [Hirundo rustica]|uniref:tubulin epsilon and delta complex protein 1 n=1 Tax=Hirundo rustica TaxID=43150 RepID=UPI001A93F6BD|nr:tubulin epsilon and delta complex protein 1 [Hirundo rustica]